MKIYIDVNKLSDSPYTNSSSFPFIFDDAVVGDFVKDITLGNPTCYLISGYRGAGKSSFVRKVENSIDPASKTLFVYTSFARYHSHNYLLRKLIRGLYQTIKKAENTSIHDYLIVREAQLKEDIENRTSELLGELYEKTFNDTAKTDSTSASHEEEQKITVDLILFVSFSLAFLLSLSNIIYPWLHTGVVPMLIALVGSFVGSIKGFISINAISTKREKHTQEFIRKTLYDDEIAGYHFNNLLAGLSLKGIKVVFVLDELDKVKEEEADNLVNEMKPYMVAGVASFIVVAGQTLYYKYNKSKSLDDSVLSTLFSRIIHVPLLTSDDFKSIFKQLIDQTKHSSEVPVTDYEEFVDYLIFKSKKVPRKFVNLVRENIYWDGNSGYLEIVDNKQYKVCSEISKAIKKIDDDQISVSFTGGDRDFYCMQLFLAGERLLAMRRKNKLFSKSDLIKAI